MALIKCPECGKEMSDTAKTCPHCGYKKPFKNPLNVFFYTHPRILGAILAVIFLGVFYWLMINGAFDSKETRKMIQESKQIIKEAEEVQKKAVDEYLNKYNFGD